MPAAWVYLLRCADGSLYTGWTIDLERRLERHGAGTASAYTRSRLPVELALAMPMASRSAARREEARIKRLTRAEKLALVGGAIRGGAAGVAGTPPQPARAARGRAAARASPAPRAPAPAP